MTVLQRCLAWAAAVLLTVAFQVTATGPAAALPDVDTGKGTPGFCPTSVGVTVVIDFQQLGGTTIVRCFPSGSPGTGLDALKGAGFQIAGVQRWGEAFICRIENRPSASESIPIATDPNYHEACINTPPATAYWSYWHAGNNCAWEYSQWGVKNRNFTPGGFEGWSFSLNATASSNPKPRIAPVRPGTAGGGCNTADEPAPTSNSVNEKQSGAGGASTVGTAGGKNGAATTGSSQIPAPKPRDPAASVTPSDAPTASDPSSPDPSNDPTFTGGQSSPNVDDTVRREAGASVYAPWVAAGLIVLLTSLSLWVSRRRRARRER